MGEIMKSKKSNLSRFDFLVHLVVKTNNDDIFALSSQLAYHLALSFFPFIIFLMSLVGFMNINSIEFMNGLEAILPESVFELIKKIILEVLESQNTGILGISILATIWTASSGFRAVIKAINKAHNICEKRSFIKRTIRAFLSTIVLAIIILVTLILLVFGRVIGDYLVNTLPFQHVAIIVWNLLRSGILIFVLIFAIAAIYKYTPSIKLKWWDVLPGAIISTVGWIIISIVFSCYINNFNNYSNLYGSLAAVFILMIWLFLTAMIFLFGVEVNSVILMNKKHKHNYF